jgi:biotin carboxyl carrier protein
MIVRQVFLDGREIQLNPDERPDAREVEPGLYSILRNGKSFEVRVQPGPEGFSIEVGDHRFQVEVRDPRNSRRRQNSAVGSGRQQVTSPMPGKVVRVLVTEGQQVEAGQGLIVVEAMKMQNEMKAFKAGRVVEIKTKDGATVSAGEVLAIIE